VKLSKAKQIRQATAFKCFLFVALGGDFNKKLRRCGRNGLCQCRSVASGKERATDPHRRLKLQQVDFRQDGCAPWCALTVSPLSGKPNIEADIAE